MFENIILVLHCTIIVVRINDRGFQIGPFVDLKEVAVSYG